MEKDKTLNVVLEIPELESFLQQLTDVVSPDHPIDSDYIFSEHIYDIATELLTAILLGGEEASNLSESYPESLLLCAEDLIGVIFKELCAMCAFQFIVLDSTSVVATS